MPWGRMSPPEVQQERYERFMEHAQAISAARLQRRVGTTMQVLVDGIDGKHGHRPQRGGRPRNRRRVRITNGGKLKVGEFAQVLVTKADAYDLTARIPAKVPAARPQANGAARAAPSAATATPASPRQRAARRQSTGRPPHPCGSAATVSHRGRRYIRPAGVPDPVHARPGRWTAHHGHAAPPVPAPPCDPVPIPTPRSASGRPA